MRKRLSSYRLASLIVFFEIVLSAVFTLALFMVNGAGEIGTDHFLLFVFVALTVISIVFIKLNKPNLLKAILWMAIIPSLFLMIQLKSTFLMP